MNTPTDTVPVQPGPAPSDAHSSRFWRSVWRTHFYAGIFAMPILVLLAVTGLVILYTDPINDLQFGELQRVEVGDERVSLDDQRAEVEDAYADWSIESVTPPKDAATPTVFAVVDESGEVYRNVSVDPYTGEVLGDLAADAGLVGLSNRLHGFLNNDTLTVPMPTLPGLFGDDPAFTAMPVGDIALEVFACWGLVLAISGVYLWWPRKKGTGRALFVPRLGKKGRARWRDLHAIPGIVLSVMLVFFVATGLPWSAFWGTSWAWVATEVTPNQENFYELDAPASDVPEVGDLDRVGNRIPWATRGEDIPTSSGGSASMPGMDMGDDTEGMEGGGGADSVGDQPAPASLDLVAAAATEEGMLDGASITLPFNDDTDPAAPVYGSYVVTNPWPSDISNQGALFIDQFSGATLGASTAAKWGALPWMTELGVQTHMGTQFGLASRIVMTVSCLLLLWSVFSGLVMFWKRRRTGTGFPRRPVDAKLQRGMIIIAVVLTVLYPLWGVSVLAVLVLDKFVVRKIPPLRRAFGMRDAPPEPELVGAGGPDA
jgi:uncharacterized iron-regulated membrane protein